MKIHTLVACTISTICGVLASPHAPSQNDVEISVKANWHKTPYKLNVIEAVASIDESLYEPLVLKLLEIDADYENEEFTMGEEYKEMSDSDFYSFAISLLDKDVDKYLAGLEISNNLMSARVQAHYEFYNSSVKSTHDCDRDVVLFEAVDPEYYCDAQAAFMLQATDYATLFTDFKLPFDRLIGTTFTPKNYIIYGDYTDEYFRQMFFNMYQFAGVGKVNLIWRYTLNNPDDHLESLYGYGAALNLKRTDYITIDDRGFTEEQQRKLVFNSNDHDTPNGILNASEIKSHHFADIHPIEEEQLSTLGFKITKFINDSKNQLHDLMALISELPKYAYSFSKLEYSSDDLSEIVESSQKSQKSFIPKGIYINNAVVPVEKTDIFEILKTIKRELSLTDLFKTIGLNYINAQNLMAEFADLMLELFHNPTRRYDLSKFSKSIVYLNDIEKDRMYAKFIDAKEAYKSKPATGKLPFARENIHQMIFAVDLTNRLQLQHLLNFYQQVIQLKLPIQIGIIPFADTGNWNDKVISKLFGTFHERGPEETFNYLAMLNRFVSSNEPVTLMTFRALDFPYLDDSLKWRYTDTLPDIYKTFDLSHDSPMIISNGIMYNFEDIDSALNQIFQDMVYLYGSLNSDKIPVSVKLGKYLRKNSVKLRDSVLLPDKIEQFKRSYLPPPEFTACKHWQNIDNLVVVKEPIRNEALITLNFLGSFTDHFYVKQVKEALSYSLNARGVKLVISDIYATSDFKKLIALETVEEKIEFLSKLSSSSVLDDFEVKDTIRTVKEMFSLDYHTSWDSNLIIAGRKITIRELLDDDKITSIVHFERFSRLSHLKQLYKSYKTNIEFTDKFDVFENFAWIVSYSYFFPASEYYLENTLPRISLSSLPKENTITQRATDDELLNITIIIDPTSEKAQEYISFVPIFTDIPFLNLNVHLRPRMISDKLPINRFYKGLINKSPKDASNSIVFENVPEKTLFNVGLNEPQRWLVAINKASTDLDNLKLDLTDSHSAYGEFILKNILVEGYAGYYEGKQLHSPAALPLVLSDGNVESDTNVMANLGYFQLKANPGMWELKIKPYTKGSLVFSLPVDIKTGVFDLDGVALNPIFEKNWGMSSVNLIEPVHLVSHEEPLYVQLYLKAMTFINSFISEKEKEADINIFTVASGHLYERFLGIMIASVMKHTEHTVKFWLIENYMSPDFKSHLPLLAEEYGFEYELIMYKWPVWLRNQRERQRTIWGYKILFLDVLFPQDLDKVIFVDSDQVVRADLQELVDIDLEGAPYGYTPMGDSRTEMEGFRFWKQGYWKDFLGDDFKYHISALYVVDLLRFRTIAAGDILRQQYQSLSYDPKSLSNLDQDLPNNLQGILDIYSLPEEWLWCETWCSDESLADAKTIDLCNNPLTKEPKLDRARRQIKEWVDLDDEVAAVISGTAEGKETDIIHDEL